MTFLRNSRNGPLFVIVSSASLFQLVCCSVSYGLQCFYDLAIHECSFISPFLKIFLDILSLLKASVSIYDIKECLNYFNIGNCSTHSFIILVQRFQLKKPNNYNIVQFQREKFYNIINNLLSITLFELVLSLCL